VRIYPQIYIFAHMCRHLNTVASAMKVERVKYNGCASYVSISIQFMTTAESIGARIHRCRHRRRRRRHPVFLFDCRRYARNLDPSEITIG
jgi:hypothetical protein